MNVNYYIELALQEAKKAFILNEVPIGSVLVDHKKNEVIALSHNKTEIQNNPTKHAEILVINEGCNKKKSR